MKNIWHEVIAYAMWGVSVWAICIDPSDTNGVVLMWVSYLLIRIEQTKNNRE